MDISTKTFNDIRTLLNRIKFSSKYKKLEE